MRRVLPLLPLLFLNMGCQKEDIAILSKIGAHVGDKVRELIPEQTPFGGTWASLTGNLHLRVKSRMQSDRFLAGQPIEVSTDGATIKLKGRLKDPVLKRRALEMVEATVGVEGVVDEIEIVD